MNRLTLISPALAPLACTAIIVRCAMHAALHGTHVAVFRGLQYEHDTATGAVWHTGASDMTFTNTWSDADFGM